MAIQNSIANNPIRYIYGLNLRKGTGMSPADEIVISEGAARDTTNSVDLLLEEELTIDISQKGINGLDEGVVVINTSYAIYLVGDSTKNNPVGAVFSTNFVRPILPAGYGVYRRIGAMTSTNTAVLKDFLQYGNGADRTIYFAESDQIITSGSATSFTTVSLGICVPPIKCIAIIKMNLVGGDETSFVAYRPVGLNSSSGLLLDAHQDTLNVPAQVEDLEAKFQYKIGGTLANLFANVTGYIDSI